MYKPFWTDEAIADLKAIHDYIFEKSVQGAENVLNDLISASENVEFAEQHPLDQYVKECRRILVRHYKILYSANENEQIINIIAIFDTNQNPEKLSKISKRIKK